MAGILDDILRAAMKVRYPETMPPILQFDAKKGKDYLAKQVSEEAQRIEKARKAAQKRINAGDYDPYFDVSKRFDVDRTKYPLASQENKTLGIMPAKEETVDKYRKIYSSPEALKNLQEAYLKGLDIPDSDRWYFMGQLEKEFIDAYGPESGRAMFTNMFSDPMAAWTGGADPTANFLMAAYDNFRKTQGSLLPKNSFDYPYPIGGRYLANNAKSASKIEKAGEINATSNPKRFNFARNFEGAEDRATMDEVMSTVGFGMQVPVPNTYGLAEEPVINLAAKANTTPRQFQEVVWHGGKGKEGKPMIQFVNEAIERTSAITGMSPKEVVQGMVRGSIPIFGLTVATKGALGQNYGTPQANRQDLLNYIGISQ